MHTTTDKALNGLQTSALSAGLPRPLFRQGCFIERWCWWRADLNPFDMGKNCAINQHLLAYTKKTYECQDVKGV